MKNIYGRLIIGMVFFSMHFLILMIMNMVLIGLECIVLVKVSIGSSNWMFRVVEENTLVTQQSVLMTQLSARAVTGMAETLNSLEATLAVERSVDTCDDRALPGNLDHSYDVSLKALKGILAERDRTVVSVQDLERRHEEVDSSIYDTVNTLTELVNRLGNVIKSNRQEDGPEDGAVAPPPSLDEDKMEDQADVRAEVKADVKADVKAEVQTDVKAEAKTKDERKVPGLVELGARQKLKVSVPKVLTPDPAPRKHIRIKPFFTDSGLGAESSRRTSTPYPSVVKETPERSRSVGDSTPDLHRLVGDTFSTTGSSELYTPSRGEVTSRSLETVVSPREDSGRILIVNCFQIAKIL